MGRCDAKAGCWGYISSPFFLFSFDRRFVNKVLIPFLYFRCPLASIDAHIVGSLIAFFFPSLFCLPSTVSQSRIGQSDAFFNLRKFLDSFVPPHSFQ
jgi:hypothetical protein